MYIPIFFLGMFFPDLLRENPTQFSDFPSFSHARCRPEFTGTGYEIKFPRYRMSPQDLGIPLGRYVGIRGWKRFLGKSHKAVFWAFDVLCIVFWRRHTTTLMSFMNPSVSFFWRTFNLPIVVGCHSPEQTCNFQTILWRCYDMCFDWVLEQLPSWVPPNSLEVVLWNPSTSLHRRDIQATKQIN